jgi:hypothetical protein
MNELIAQLAEEATYEMEFGGDVLQTSNGEVTYEIPAGFIEAFAKLIVKEFTEVAGCNGHVSGFTLGDLIKEHFGVEE